jgi:hypothetical protein
MAGDSDEPDNAAARLEAALERIAVAAARRDSAPAAPPAVTAPPDDNAVTAIGPEIVARLDGLIERLRGALAVRPG